MSRESIESILAEAEELPYGPDRLSRNEEAVREADRIGDLELQWTARMGLVTTATFGGYIDKAIVAFGWLASACDREPDRVPESTAIGNLFMRGIDLLWAYKWVVQNMVLFASIRRDQVEDSLDDMERRYQRNGRSLRPVHVQRARAAMVMGDDEVFEASLVAYRDSGRDLYADCAACEAHFEVEAALHQGDLGRADRLFDAMLRSNLSCAEVPHITYADLIHPLHLAGDDRASHYCARAERLCADNRDFLPQMMDVIDYHRVAGEVSRAASLVGRYAPWAAESRVDEHVMRFLVSAEMTARASDEPLALPGFDDLRDVSSNDELAGRISERVDRFVERFDARNGNDSVGLRIATLRKRM